jgi:6-phosphogluconolactonase
VLYAINELDGTIDVFGRDKSSGALAARQNVAALEQAAAGDAAAADIHLTPDSRFLYASIRRDSVIAAFSVDAGDGTLTPIDPIAVETTPRGLANQIDPDGRFLICAGRDAAMIGVHAIDPATGRLNGIAQHPTSPNPNWVEIIDLP